MYDLNYSNGIVRQATCETYATLAEAEARAATLTGFEFVEISDEDGETVTLYSYGRRIEQAA
jgi:hypothetical protein